MVKQLRIGPITYKVVKKKLAGSWGQIDTAKRVIYVDSSNSKEQMMTLLHEALHGVANQSGLSQVMGDLGEEIIVRSFENFICMLLKDNPAFTKQLIESLNRK